MARQGTNVIRVRARLVIELERRRADKARLIERLIHDGIDMVERGDATAQDLAAAVPVTDAIYARFLNAAREESVAMPVAFDRALSSVLDAAGAP
jgi:hypothetical protein